MEIKTIGELITALATKAGVDAADKNLVNILSNAELSKVPIHSDLATSLDTNLLSIDQALDNHPRIKTKYTVEALNAFDRSMEAAMTEAGLDEPKITELKAIKSSYKRFEALTPAIKEALGAKAKDANGNDTSALQKQVDELLGKLQNSEKEYKANITKLETETANEKKSFRIALELRNLLGAHKTVFDELPADAKQAAIDSLVRKALQDNAAEFDFDEAGAFIVKKSDGSSLVRANNSKFTPASFIDDTLANNKVLVVSDPKGSNGPKGNSGNNNNNTGGNGNGQGNQLPKTITANGDGPKGNNQAVMNINRKRREAAAANSTQS